jgi:NTP pyrophosphatase (non-canonical NTP hydrolase)
MTTIRQMQREAHENALAKGWWDGITHGDDSTVPEKLCLIHSEVSEALEDFRNSSMSDKVEANGKPFGFSSELADIVIRVMDLCGHLDIDLEAAIQKKHAFNLTRPPRHGGKRA